VSSDDVLTVFPDADQLDDWAIDAMAWAVDKGMISGSDAGMLEPLSAATRAQAAQIILNFSAIAP
jgi:hypothetical protein